MKRESVFVSGDYVLVSHDQGLEPGEIYSINLKAGKALIYISNPDCPHFYGVNISQLKALHPATV
jgi:hypothetical protein